VEVLRKTFFPPPPAADLRDIDGTIYLEPLLMEEVIAEQEVRRAIRRPKPDKAPGIDGILNRFLRIVLEGLISAFYKPLSSLHPHGLPPQVF